MIRGLVEKELRQHAVALTFLLVGLACGLELLNGNAILSQIGGTPLEALRVVLLTITPISCLILAQLLIAGEFRNKTQLFLEGLPLSRWKMLAVKYCLGLAVVLLGLGIVVGLSTQRSVHSDAINARFELILSSKSLAWAWFAYSVFFAHGFLGRYRIVSAIATVAILFGLSKVNVPVEKFWAFQLVDSRFAYERMLLPTASLTGTALAIAGFTALGFWMGLVRDASVASLLAERMSSREKTLLTFAALAILFLVGSIAQRESEATPVRLPGSYEAVRGPVHVTATAAVDAPARSENEAVKKTADQIADALQRVCEYLGCKSLPPIFIVHRRDLAGDAIENGNLKIRQGLMVRTNLTASDFKLANLERRIIREALLVRTANRANIERNAWALDGFPLWWEHLEGKHQQDDQLKQVARKTMPRDFSGLSVSRWMTIRKDGGDEDACVLAWSGLTILAQKHSPESCRKFLSQMLGHESSEDVRGWLYDLLDPMERRFKNSTGVTLDAFAAEWRAELSQAVVAEGKP